MKIPKYKGNLSAIARGYQITRAAVQKYIRERPALVEALQDARESFLDVAEDSLGKAVKKGEAWAVSLALKTLGKDRGYVERHETKVVPASPESELTDEQLEREIEERKKRIGQTAEGEGTADGSQDAI